MGLRGDPKPGLVLGLRESGVKGGSTCKNPWLSPEEGEGVLERGDDAQHERHHGTQTQTQQQQEKEHSPEERPREQRDDLHEGQEREAGALLNLQGQRSEVPLPPPLKAHAAGPRPCNPGKGSVYCDCTALPTLPTFLSGTSESRALWGRAGSPASPLTFRKCSWMLHSGTLLRMALLKGGRRRSSQELEVEVGFFVRVGGRTSGGRIPWATSIISFSAFLRMGELEPSGPWHTVLPLLILQMREISSPIVRTVKDSLP